MRMSEERSGVGPGASVRGYFFATPALSLRLDLVRDYIHDSRAPVLVSGAAGAGKSAFLNQLVYRTDRCWQIVRVPAVRSFSAAEVVAFLNTELKLPVGDPVDSMITELDRFLKKIAIRRRLAVVVVDDAHQLSDAALVQLVTMPEKLESTSYRVLLTGLPALRNRLTALLAAKRSPLRPHVVSIPCLNEREVASYIDMKLYHAGIDHHRPLSRQVIDDIAHRSDGHPGRINAMTDALLAGSHRHSNGRWTAGRLRHLVSRLSGLRTPG